MNESSSNSPITKVLIICGEHRNEKAAVYLAPLVADELQKMGYEPILCENPETRTLLDFTLEAQNPFSLRLVEHKILYQWSIRARREHPKISDFNLHNYGVNPTMFSSARDLAEQMGNMCIFSDLPGLENEPFADLIYTDGNGLIEIPEIQQETISEEQLARVRQILPFRRFDDYLLSTNMERTREKGWLSVEMAQTIAKGIDFMLTYKGEIFDLKRT